MKYLLSTIYLVFFITQTYSQHLSFTNGIQEFSSGKTLPDRSFANGDAYNCEVTYNFFGATISEQNVSGEIYNLLRIEGFAQLGQVGAPALPAHNEIIAMPRGSVGNIVILESNYSEYQGFMIHPALKPARDTEGAEGPIFERDMAVYNSNSFFPSKIVEITNVGLSRGTPLAKVQVTPVQFNPVTGIIRVYTKISYRIEYQGGLNSFDYIAQENSLHYTNLLKLSVLNSGSIPDGISNNQTGSSSGSRSGEKNYIIITHSEYLTEANELANWKRQMGYTVEVVSQSSWNATQVKSEILTRYNSWIPKPDYFLIIGDHTGSYAVPGEVHLAPDNSSFATDLYFACMDGGSDWHPDIAHGRISVSSSTEASVIVDKVIDYEKTPPSTASFYSNMLSCAQYQDTDNNDGYADRRFCHTSEDIRDYLQNSHSYLSERVYEKSSSYNVTMLRYNNGYYSNGQLLPSELRSTSFNWSGGASDITSAINAGKFLVFHRDHGYVGGSGWAHPYYTTSSMDALSNGNLLPIVFSMNCHTGEFLLSNCFAEKFLRMNNKGAVGVVAAAYYSYSGYNDALSEGMIDAIWANPGLSPVFGSGGTGNNYTIGTGNEIYTMGDVVNQGLYAMEQNWTGYTSSHNYQYELFHWFGDPAMRIWTANPNSNVITASHSATISCTGSTFAITGSTPGATATLVYNNELLGETVLDGSGNGSISYSISTPGSNVDLTISKHNHYTYISNLTISGTCAFPPAILTLTTTAIGQTSVTANGNITNDFGSAVTESGMVYSLNPNPVIGAGGVTKVQTSPTITSGTFSINLTGLTTATTYYIRAYAINANGTGYGTDDTFSTLTGPVTLPWTEDWESVSTTTYTADVSSVGGAPEWSYDMVNTGGRLRFAAGSGYYHGGARAATLDRYPDGTLNTNYLIATLNMDTYSTSTNVELEFYFMHHGEESHTNDRVWVRGNSTDPWIEIYNLEANKGFAGTWNFASGLDVDATLATASQTISSTFQIRFGQEDNWPSTSTTVSDGYTFDDIVLTGGILPFITVSSPNGGESWQPGTTHVITWNDNISDNVKIELYKSGIYNSTIVTSIPSGGNYDWIIPTGLTAGSDYTVKITSNADPSVYDFSNNHFTIDSPSPPTNFVLGNTTIVTGQTECYDATNIILVAGSGTTVDILSGGDATFIAGNKIIFEPGFHSHLGSNCDAYITLSGNYCSNPSPIVANNDILIEESVSYTDPLLDQDSGIKIYPNPTTGNTTIDFLGLSTTAEILILNFQGKQVTQTKCDNQILVNIDISQLPGGIYIVVVKTTGNIITSKIIKTY